MKQFYILVVVLFFAGGLFSVNAHDLIIMKDGNVIEAKVTEISATEIKYRRVNHLDGPMIVIPVARVLSIKYDNGTLEIMNGDPAVGQRRVQPDSDSSNIERIVQTVRDSSNIEQQIDTSGLLQSILNTMPAIPIAGNNLKFEFNGDTWIAKVNGENFFSGNTDFVNIGQGCILTLKQTHIWPGAAGKVAGKIPGGGILGKAVSVAGSAAQNAGPIEASAPEIILEYKAGPPAALVMMTEKQKAEAMKAAGIAYSQARPEPLPKEPKKPNDSENAKLWTLGASIGTSSVAPLIIGTVHGTLAPFKGSFLELGMDIGGKGQDIYPAVEYFSLYPFVNYALFVPFPPPANGRRSGWYLGAGVGVMFTKYTFGEVITIIPASGVYYAKTVDPVWENVFAVNAITGFTLFEIFDISYTMRTDFNSVNSKFSLGYSYRFR